MMLRHVKTKVQLSSVFRLFVNRNLVMSNEDDTSKRSTDRLRNDRGKNIVWVDLEVMHKLSSTSLFVD